LVDVQVNRNLEANLEPALIMTKFVVFVCGFIIVIVGQVVVNAGRRFYVNQMLRVYGIPFGNVKWYFEYLKADNLSDSYKNKCAVLRNAFNTHYLNVENNSTCSGKLDLVVEKWSNILANRINNITSLKLKYNVMECNCQIMDHILHMVF